MVADIDWISQQLGLSAVLDRKSAQILDSLVGEFDTNHVRGLFEGKKVIVFGCGPSLDADIIKIRSTNIFFDYTIVAVDGATKPLIKIGVIPDVIVTDLDGDNQSIVEASNNGSTVILHAHGSNIGRIRREFPHLGARVYGTTQREPTGRILNFGGFTDGDRAVYLAEQFRPEWIVLAGMDFGKKAGRYSGRYDGRKKIEKLRIGKKLLEQLASKKRVPILNLTGGGVDLEHIPRISVDYLEGLTFR